MDGIVPARRPCLSATTRPARRVQALWTRNSGSRITIDPCARGSCSSSLAGRHGCGRAGHSGAAPPHRSPAPALTAQEQEKADRAEGRRNQKVERIHLEDSANVIDEVRYGGQTQSITVQPKAKMPEYEIQPTDLSRSRPADNRDGSSSATGKRLWNVFKF